MRYLILTIMVFVLHSSCSSSRGVHSQEKSGLIVYTLPDTVERLLVKNISARNKANLYFSLDKYKGRYMIYPSTIEGSGRAAWIEKTNRVLFLDGSFYPLIIGLDEEFGCVESMKEIKKMSLSEEYLTYTKSYEVYDGFYIEFNRDGSFVKEL